MSGTSLPFATNDEPEKSERQQRYEKHIAPLVKQAYRMCQEHDIPCIMTFQLVPECERGVLLATTTHIPDWADGRFALGYMLLAEETAISMVPVDPSTSIIDPIPYDRLLEQ